MEPAVRQPNGYSATTVTCGFMPDVLRQARNKVSNGSVPIANKPDNPYVVDTFENNSCILLGRTEVTQKVNVVVL